MTTEILLTALVSTIATAGVAYTYFTGYTQKQLKKKEAEVSKETEDKENRRLEETQARAKQILLDAKEESIKLKELAEQEATKSRRRITEQERALDLKKAELEKMQRSVNGKENEVKATANKLKEKEAEIEKLRLEQINKLESVASMTKNEAKELILSNLEKTLDHEIAKRIKQAEEEYKAKVDTEARELLIETMHSAATDYVAEFTISKIKLKDEDMKGKIIGKDGRNIKAFEDATGVNIDLETGDEVRLSSFDSVRREIARIAMERLLKDGRIHPARIEEIVSKTSKEMEKVLYKAGSDLCNKVEVYNLPRELVLKLGHFKYRTSYGQNMIIHTLEETQMGTRIAREVGADVKITKLACLLHDIGKVITDKEGSHVELGVEYLKTFKLPNEIITAIEEHHNDKPSTMEGVILQIADSVSGARPGARYEDYENYIKRLKGLEETAMSFQGVNKAYAISAGRELRVIVNPEDIDDAKAVKLSHDLAEQIQKEQTYPGTVKVIVIRETRISAMAK